MGLPVNKERAVMKFLVAMKEMVGNTHKRINNIYRNAAFDMNAVGRWEKRVRKGEIERVELLDFLHQPVKRRTNNIR
jgi:hypothetical protein